MSTVLSYRRRRRCLLVAAASMFVAASAACADDDADTVGATVPFAGTMPAGGPARDLTPVRETPGRDVVMIGDSITVASTPGLLSAAEELGVDLEIYAEVGRRIIVGRSPEAGVGVLEHVLANGRPDLFVIALGTNDIGKYGTQAEYEAVIDEMLELVPAEMPLVWINTYLRNDPDDSARFNAALIAALERRGDASIAKWSNIASADGILSDGIHPTDDGAIEFADLVGREIDNWLGDT